MFLTLFVSNSKREQFIETLNRFAPEAFTAYLTDLILSAKVKFKIVPGRSTKLGDFRVKAGEEKPTITVNGDLNKFSFLVTAIHELAHLEAFQIVCDRVVEKHLISLHLDQGVLRSAIHQFP